LPDRKVGRITPSAPSHRATARATPLRARAAPAAARDRRRPGPPGARRSAVGGLGV